VINEKPPRELPLPLISPSKSPQERNHQNHYQQDLQDEPHLVKPVSFYQPPMIRAPKICITESAGKNCQPGTDIQEIPEKTHAFNMVETEL
jgi:hypothetical protein